MSAATISRAMRSQEKRAHIYQVAMRLFKRRGFAQTTIRDICREAGISNGTFYHFFGDKSGVVLEFFREIDKQREAYLRLTQENLTRPFQSVYNYFIHMAALQDLMGKDFTRETMYADPDALAARHLSAVRHADMTRIAQLLRFAGDAGTLPGNIRALEAAEYLLTVASGVIFNWITLSEGESAVALMRRMLPKCIAAVSEEPLDTDWEPKLYIEQE